MKNIKLLLSGILLVMYGCMDLNETPQSSLLPETFYTTTVQIEATFASSMDNLWCQWCDNYSYGMTYFVNDDQLYVGGRGNLNIAPNHATALWRNHYASLLNINGALKALLAGKVEDASADVTDQLIGQAKFLRAYNYFMLVRMYGGVPLYLDTDDPLKEPKARATVAEVYAQIVDDFTDAADKLPVSWSDTPGKPTKSAANGLLAKAYLTMATAPLNETSNYQKAADAAKKVMDEGTYSLVYDIREVFLQKNKYGPEMMWSFNSTYDDLATDAPIWGPGADPYWGWGDYLVDTHWDSLYVQQPRKDAYLMDSVNGVHYKDYDYNNYPSVKKYLDPYISMEDYQNYTSPNNFPIIRYADVLLIFAEAENQINGGPNQAALDAINEVIDRANGYMTNPNYPLLTTTMSKEAFDKAVINERNLELCFEDDRYFDLLRKRMLLEVNPWASENFTEDDYLFPIPAEDLRLNPLLTQNPGYPLPTGD